MASSSEARDRKIETLLKSVSCKIRTGMERGLESRESVVLQHVQEGLAAGQPR